MNIKSKIILGFSALILLMVAGCDNDDEPGAPIITNVRLTTDPETITEASFADLIVIQGQNLENTQEVYFNNVKAELLSTYVTNENIIVKVPSTPPSSISNKVTVITPGGEASGTLEIKVPAPIVKAMSNEFANEGEEVTITGDYFYEVQSVVFTGDTEGEIVAADGATSVTVKVPEGVSSGPVKVITLFGEHSSVFKFRDTEAVFQDFDEKGKCWGAMPEKNEASGKAPAPLDGNYVHSYKTEIPGQFWWDDGLVVAHCGGYAIAGSLDNYALKFEINVPESWMYGYYQMNLSWSHYYLLRPWFSAAGKSAPFTTNGKWMTITIPIKDFKTDNGTGEPISNVDSVKDLVLAFQNPGPEVVTVLNANFDNFRVVRYK